jgi:HK97 family phage portal protein
MGFWTRLLGLEEPPARAGIATVRAAGQQAEFFGLDDPRFLEFVRQGGFLGYEALRAACVLRCIDILSSSHAMLPTRLIDRSTYKDAEDHPLYELLRWQPNDQHTAFEFYQLMDVRRLLHGNAYAAIIRGLGGRPIALQPIDPFSVTVQQMPDWSLKYFITLPGGHSTEWPAADMLHVRDLSHNGIIGAGRAKLAHEAIRVARAAEKAQASIFENGMIMGGALTHPQALGPEAYKRLTDSLADRYSGTDNAGKWLVLEEGMKAERFTMTGQEAQTVEARNHQIEDVARVWGVPRPFLMMDDTSWGSGIEQLAIMFVRFGLNPGIIAWEQALRRVLLKPQERKQYAIDVDEHELLRGTMKDQAEFFSKALAGHPWLVQNEVREEAGYGDLPNADTLKDPVGGPPAKEPPK